MGKINRRKFFKRFGAGALIGGVAIGYPRLTGYQELPTWKGKVLSQREAQILIAACEVILPSHVDANEYIRVAKNVDAYVNTFSESAVTDIHLLFNVVEHLTPISLHISRLTKLDAKGKNSYFKTLDRIGSQLRQVYKGIRDLCLLGYYQQDAAWDKLKYSGPVVGPDRNMRLKYAKLIATAGKMPQSKIS